MHELLKRIKISIEHIQCLDEVFFNNHPEYNRIEIIFNSDPFKSIIEKISKELYAGGKQPRGHNILNRQMILGDIIEYIFTGRAYYFASKSNDNFKQFLKLILYTVNQLLIMDSITVKPSLREKYIRLLEARIDRHILYEKIGDENLATDLTTSTTVLGDSNWERFNLFVDSILPKTLGCPKELIVFAELIRLKKGIIIPLLLIQRIFGNRSPIAPPDFLLIKENKEIFGIELGYKKEEQSREFSIRTSIPTFATDLKNNMHNRCQICGEILLYCDPVIEDYVNNNLGAKITTINGTPRYLCNSCPNFNNGNCRFSNYYGIVHGNNFRNEPLPNNLLHYHAKCVRGMSYQYRNNPRDIHSQHINEFFAQYPELLGFENL